MCPVIISTHISKMLSTAESKRPWRAKAAYPYMKAQGGGVILNASSFAALDPNAGRATYSAAKAAVKNLSAPMAAEFAAANIRVLAYVPGMIATEIAAESIEKYGDALLADIPCRRLHEWLSC